MSFTEQLEWDLSCEELGPVHGLIEYKGTMNFDGYNTVKKCYEIQLQEEDSRQFQKYLWMKGIPPKEALCMLGPIFLVFAHFEYAKAHGN